jgi:aspartate kinase
LAAVLGADLCEIYTDVDGVFTADPRIVPNARKLDEVSYEEMLELATLGARVLHNRSVEIAKQYNVRMCVRSSFSGADGTRITEPPLFGEGKGDCIRMEKRVIVGCAGDLDVCKIAVKGISGEGKGAYGLFSLLARECINVDIIIQSVRSDGTRDITFTVSKGDAAAALNLIRANMTQLGASKLETDDSLAKVSVVGAGMVSDHGTAAKMFEAIHELGVDIVLITTSEIKISVLVKADDYAKTIQAVHDKFGLGER